MSTCWSCGEGEIISDPISATLVCNSCGIVHSTTAYIDEEFDQNGRPIGTVLFSGDFGSRERKIRDAKTLISDLTRQLGLPPSRADDVTLMISSVTDGEFGTGTWFPVLVASCSYLVMRQHRLPLPLAQIAAAIDCDIFEIGRMVGRVARHLDLEPLPQFDAVQSLERAVRSYPPLAELPKGEIDELIGQGRFLLHCAMKWSLLTGRQPLPVIAAVVTFVTEVNGVAVGVEEIAEHIYAGITTSKIRLKELKETLVKVAKALLPWGKDVTPKNLTHFGKLLIRLMELKSKNGAKFVEFNSFEIDVDGLIDYYVGGDGEDLKYLKGQGGDCVFNLSGDELRGVKLLTEPLKVAYKNVLQKLAEIKARGGLGDAGKRRNRGGFDFDGFKSSWQGDARWAGDKGLKLEEILEKDVGYDALLPAFVTGVEANRSRRRKIEAARGRINEIMKRPEAANRGFKDGAAKPQVGKKRRRKGVVEANVDWEDCIIEILLLHGVADEEIEQGQYKRLFLSAQVGFPWFSKTLECKLKSLANK